MAAISSVQLLDRVQARSKVFSIRRPNYILCMQIWTLNIEAQSSSLRYTPGLILEETV